MKRTMMACLCVVGLVFALAGCGGGGQTLEVEEIMMLDNDVPMLSFVDKAGELVPMPHSPDEWFTNATFVAWVAPDGVEMTGNEAGRLVLADDSHLLYTFIIDGQESTLVVKNGTVFEVEEEDGGWRLVPGENGQEG